MIFIFGDSHANFNMSGFDLHNMNLYQNAITLHRIGRDNTIINFSPIYNHPNNIFILFYGEIDCRCHIKKQLLSGRVLDDIIEELVSNYFKTINNNIKLYKKIIIGSITPPVNKENYESIHGPITHEFPILGTNEERVLYTKMMNKKLEEYCEKYNYTFLNVFDHYSDKDGILYFDKSDKICHITDNKYIHENIKKILNKY